MIKKWIYFLMLITPLTFAMAASGIKGKEEEKEVIPDDPSVQFKDTKFLQIDRVNVPKELNSIEEQIRQNLIDVILVSKTHVPMYSQKREGYNESYKKFFGVQVRISPIVGAADSYEVSYFYYNWTVNKFDKTIYKRISKFNVMNEVRIGMYELLLGKEFVAKNKDAIEIQNYERIQAVRKAIEDEKRISKLKSKQNASTPIPTEKEVGAKKKLKREDKEKKKNENSQFAGEREESGVSESTIDASEAEENAHEDVGEVAKKEKNEFKKENSRTTQKNQTTEKKDKSETSQTQSTAKPGLEIPPVGTSSIKYNSFIQGKIGLSSFGSTSLTPDQKIKTETNLKYILLGASLDLVQDLAKPLQYEVDFKIGIPFFKKEYLVPSYKLLNASVIKNDWPITNLQLEGGIEYSPLNFINVPDFGTGFKVFENNFVWLKIGSSYKANFSHRSYLFQFNFLKSLMSSSNQSTSLSGNQLQLLANTMISPKYGAEIQISSFSLSGDFKVSGQYVLLQMLYRFEN